VLTKASIQTANTLITTLPDEAHNLYLTLTARDMNRKLRIIARADFEQGEKKLRRAGADQVISPHIIGGDRMAMAALRPHVVDFMHMATLAEGGLSIEEIVVPDGCEISGKSILESQLKANYGVTVIGVKPASRPMSVIPGPSTILAAGDTLVLLGPIDGLDRLSADWD
jgi:voltage-gated potassium channel